jgi:hypothetical protein
LACAGSCAVATNAMNAKTAEVSNFLIKISQFVPPARSQPRIAVQSAASAGLQQHYPIPGGLQLATRKRPA